MSRHGHLQKLLKRQLLKDSIASTARSRITLVRGGEVYAPDRIGRADVLLGGGRILRVGAGLEAAAQSLGAVHVIEASRLRVVPGYIDQHIHLFGGGDAAGPQGRAFDLKAEDLALAGITSAVGVVGVEMETRGLPLLLRKTTELRSAGLTALMYTGSFRLPAPHLLWSAAADVCFIEQVKGVKTAVSERLYPNQDLPALMQLAGEMLQAKALSGKAAVLHCHMGSMAAGMEPIFALVEQLGIDPSQILPTHVNRTPEFSPVFEHALRFAKLGGTIDFSSCVSKQDANPTGIDVHEAVRRALDAGVPLEQITFSSDSNVPGAVRDGDGRLTGMRLVPPTVLHRDLMRTVHEASLPLEQALQLVTSNVARVLGMQDIKGSVSEGADADLVLLDEQDRIDTVIAGGEVLVRERRAIPRGPFAANREEGA
jgi:beta-aspartyl-dipeptidase (metallo-type)